MAFLPELSVIIPAYNDASRLEPTVRDVVRYCRSIRRSLDMIVVDDGSRDGTSALVDRLCREIGELRLIRLAQNQGKGFAVRSGVVNARGRTLLFADADGATSIQELERLERALADGADVAIGSRAMFSPEVRVRTKWYRRLMGRTFHLMVELLAVRGFHDTQCGFKLSASGGPRPLLPHADARLQLRRRGAGHGAAGRISRGRGPRQLVTRAWLAGQPLDGLARYGTRPLHHPRLLPPR
jgi:dolichyl-phosphate beta-glucosyltransferase